MISVIIPVYNCEKFLYVCLKSVLKQSFTDLEIICIDDCSTDSSLEILKYFANRDSRIKILENSENKGACFSRNKGIEQAKGEYLFLLDGDDWITHNALNQLYENAKRNDSDLVFYKIARLNGQEFILNQPAFDLSNNFDKNTNFDNLTFTYKEIKNHVLNTSFSPCLKLYKKSFLDKYGDLRFPEGLAYEDVPFHVKTLLRASKISFIPKFFYVYMIDNQASKMHDYSKVLHIFKIIDMVENFLYENSFFDEFKFEFYLFKITQIVFYLNTSQNAQFFNIAKENFKDIDSQINDYMKNILKNSYSRYWNYYLKILNSNSVEEYLNSN